MQLSRNESFYFGLQFSMTTSNATFVSGEYCFDTETKNHNVPSRFLIVGFSLFSNAHKCPQFLFSNWKGTLTCNFIPHPRIKSISRSHCSPARKQMCICAVSLQWSEYPWPPQALWVLNRRPYLWFCKAFEILLIFSKFKFIYLLSLCVCVLNICSSFPKERSKIHLENLKIIVIMYHIHVPRLMWSSCSYVSIHAWP